MKDREKFDGFANIDAGDILRSFYFLSKAVAKGKDWRPMFQDIHIEAAEDKNYTAVATDGRRMHVVTEISAELGAIFGFGPGEWKLISAKPTCVQIARITNREQPFVNWRKVIPTGQAEYLTEFDGFSLSPRRASSSSVNFTKLMRSFPEVTPIDIRYLEPVDTFDPWTVSWYAPNKAVVFDRGDWSAIIMPLSEE